MAGALKGIVVEIGADTKKLGAALKGVENQTRTLQNELRGVNSLLKMDPGNTTLLAQKQKLLSKSITETKTKLEALRQTQAKIKSGEIKATEEQYRDLEREIVATEQKLKALEAEQKRFGSVAIQKIGAAGTKMKAFGQKCEAAGQKMAPLSKACAAVAGASVAAAYNFEKSMSKVQALSGASGDDMTKLEKKAREMGSTTVYSATDAADAFSYMALAGWDTKKMVSGIRPVLDLAASSQMDLADASDIVTDYLTAFGLSAEDAGKFVDQMAYAQSHSNTNTTQLAEAYKNCASTASSMGFSVEDTTAVLMNMANAGVKGGEAGTALSSIMTRLGTNTKGCTAMLEKHGVKVYDNQGKMKSLGSILKGTSKIWGTLSDKEKANFAKTIAGTNHYSKFTTIMEGLSDKAKKGGQSFEDYTKDLENCDGAAQDMAKTMTDNLYGTVSELKSALGEAGIALGQSLVPAIKKVTAKIKELVEKFNSLPEDTKGMVAVGVVVGAALAPVLLIVGKVAGAIGGLLGSIGGIVNFLKPIVSFIIQRIIPAIGSVVTAIAGVIGWPATIAIAVAAAIAALYATCEPFRDFVNGLVQAIVGFVQGLVDSIVDFFTVQIPAALDTFVQGVQSIPDAVSQFVSDVGTFFSQLPGKIGYAIGYAIGTVAKFGLELVRIVTEEVPKFVGGIFKWFSQLPGKIWRAIVGAIGKLGKWCNDLMARAKYGIPKLVLAIIQWMKALPGKIWNAISSAPGKIATMCSQMLSKATSGIAKVAKSIYDGLKSIPGKVVSIGGSIVEGLWRGIDEKRKWLLNTIGGFANGVVKGAQDAFKVNSPSKRFRDEVGRYLPEGIGVGIEKNADKAIDPLKTLSDDMVRAATVPSIEREMQARLSLSGGGQATAADRLGEAIALLEAIRDKGQTIVMDSGELVGSIIGDVDRRLGSRARLAERGL